MTGSVNKVILIGNLGKDPEVRHLENGSVVAKFSLATSEVYVEKSTGEKKEITDWHDIIVWRNLAEFSGKYLKKGYKVYLEGKLKKRSWQDKENTTRYTTEIYADTLTILSKPEKTEEKGTKTSTYSAEGTPSTPGKMDPFLYPDHNEDILPF
jgi:single-strand DNA-binding protein